MSAIGLLGTKHSGGLGNRVPRAGRGQDVGRRRGSSHLPIDRLNAGGVGVRHLGTARVLSPIGRVSCPASERLARGGGAGQGAHLGRTPERLRELTAEGSLLSAAGGWRRAGHPAPGGALVRGEPAGGVGL